MDVLSRLFALVLFTSGRRISVYNQLRPLAEQRGLPTLVEHIERAKLHDIRTRGLDNRWQAQLSHGYYTDEVQELHNQISLTLTSIRDVAEAHARGLPADSPLHDKVDQFIAGVFPAGVAAITSLAYVDEVAAVEVIVSMLQDEFEPLVAELGLEHKVRYLAELTVAYRQGVDTRNKPLEFAMVREARARGQQYLLEIISIILGTYYDSNNPAHVAARDELLEPIFDHETIIRTEHRSRRGSRSEEPAPAELGGDAYAPADAGHDADAASDSAEAASSAA